MNKLDIKVINTVPAEVNFNFEEISNHLDGVLKQYEGIILTDDTVADGKKVVADLRKGQKALDEFRKKTKKELTKSVTEFESKCKELGKKFDEVINPINEQAEQFEEKRREEKSKEVQKIIDEVCKLKGLKNLPIEDSYLNKSTSLKSVKSELIKVADSILLEQYDHEKNVALIEGRIDLSNTKNKLNIIKEPYISMLEYTDVDNILKLIEKDSLVLMSKPVVQTQVMPSLLDELYVETYEVEGTEEQLDILENFLNTNGYKWTNK